MSYCRFSDGDVYLYAHVDGGYECCACALQPLVPTIFTNPLPGDAFAQLCGATEPCEVCHGEFNGCTACGMHDTIRFPTRQKALDHLQEHRDAGHTVPQYAFDTLRDEIANHE